MASFSLPSASTEPSSQARRWKYDVFLSFRGRDTLNGITVQIRNRLESLGIRTFMATIVELQVGDTISPTPMEAIEGSRFAIVVLSPNYAYSTWCLEELVNICNCMANEDRVFPLFYHVDPSEVRYQQRSFGEAFCNHERYRRDQLVKVQEWRSALKYVANMSGWISRDYKTEGELVEDIVERMCRRIQPIDVKSTIWIEDKQDTPQWRYDVFVSFKAEDISKGFLSELYRELQNTKNIRTFMDDEQLQQGNDISQTRLLAIEESRCAIVLLSPNYASSPRCLEELTKIFSCVGKHGKIVPVFHNVEPSAVRYQKRSFEAAFKIHEERQEEEKVKQWRDALTMLANLSGWDSRNYESSKKIANDIVKYVNHIVRPQNMDFRSAEHKKPADITTIPIEEYHTTTQVTDQTCNLPVAPRSRRNYTFLPSAPRWKHEVYLSFSCVDTCMGITSEIYDNLQNIRGVKTFMNDLQFQLGDPNSPRFLITIEESRFAIVVLSQNYASSTRCLEELAAIVQSMKDGNRLLPIFYKVDASDIRNLEGSFGVAFKNHESSEGLEKVKLWRNALEKVGHLAGWDSRKYGSDKELVEDIVKLVWSKVHQVRFDNESTARLPKDMIFSRSLPSAESAPGWKYDVFLSFRGEDARETILSHLYRELSDKRGVKTFKDDQKLEKGTPISPNLLMAIEESKFAVVVLSPNYASSTWCLDELIHIFECMEGKNTILPIFYHVDPSHVRKLEHTFKEAFAKHEDSGQDKQKMQQWRKALAKVANLSGWDLENYKDEGELVEDIGKFVWRKVIQLEVDSTMSAGGFEAFTATREAMKQVMKALKNDKVNIFGIYGKGGVGKTTIAKHVGAQAQKDRVFDHVVQISVSRSPDLRNIQDKLAYILGLNFQDATDIQKAITLKKRFMGGDKILLILDNVWSSIDLSSLGIPSFHELQRCNSKVLIISRDRDVCRAVGCQVEINLAILSEVDSLTLFRRQSGKSMESKDVYDAARKVAKQCAGLPIALIAVAKALGDQSDFNVWRKAARRLKKTLKDEEHGFNCIKLSYDYLKGEHVKSSFLLCCLFPDNEDIRIAELTEYVYGIGFFKYFKTMQEARAATHLAVIYLKACNLLMDGAEDGCIRMHDVIRDMAISILQKNGHNFFPAAKIIDGLGFSSAGKIDAGHHSLKPEKEKMDDQHFCPAAKIEDDISSASKKDASNHPSKPEKEEDHIFLIKSGSQLRDWPMDIDKSCSGISVMRNEILKLPEEFVCSKLQILLLQGNADVKDIPDAFIKSLRAMRVLDLSDTTISSLPPSFGLLVNLNTLYLDGCQSIIDVTALRGLSSLQILSMRQCRLKELPKEIEELSQLRILDITSDFLSIVPPKVVSRLQSLEELYMQCKYTDWKRNSEGAENAGFDELTGLPHLYILKVNISDADCLPKIVEFIPSWAVFDICISKETLPKDYSSEPYFNHDHSRALTLSSPISTLPGWFVMSVTKKADSLQYIDCNNLNNLLLEHELGILHGLKYLAVIGRHEKLEGLMNTNREVFDPNEPVFESIEEMHLVGLTCLKELCVGELPPGSLCNLKFVKVETCPNLVNPLLPKSFCNLRILMVKGCMKLKSLFTPEVARCLLQLEDLQVADCRQLNRIIEASEETVKKEISFPKLGTLSLCSLPELTWFYCTGNATIKCVLLKQLSVLDCSQFSTSISDFHTWEQVEVNDLRHLRINNDEMEGASFGSDAGVNS